MGAITSKLFSRSWWRDQTPSSLFYNSINAALFTYYKIAYGGRCTVAEEDWDNLVILDACRYDTFDECSTLHGTLECRISKGTNTGEFLGSNFADEEFHDIVYVTGNPHVSRLCEGYFHDIVPVWETDWDDALNTVTPAAMVEATEAAVETYPNKRIISHWVQPHAPYIGKFAQETFGVETGITINRMMATGEIDDVDASRENYPNSWSRFLGGEISKSDMIKAYRENLELALEPLEELLDELSGKTVVTSDHGEMFGGVAWPLPIRRHGHGTKVHTPALVKVPWLTVEHETRRETTAEEPFDNEQNHGEQIRDRLADLGYVE